MKKPLHPNKQHLPAPDKGFALVSTLMLMILLMIISVGILSLSSVTLRNSSQNSAQAQAQANARMALMIAIAELQKEMGPDMRVSAESALFDSDKDTSIIEGVAQSRWLSSYNAWGNWLNANYTPPGGSSLNISDTYQPRREPMFRRWLLSLPAGKEADITAPLLINDWDNMNSVVLVGKNSLGETARSDQITRAYLTSIDESGKKTGKYAWWISPENHKALINRAKNPRTLSADEWQTAQGNTNEVGVGALTGLTSLDNDPLLSKKIFSYQTLAAAQVDENVVKQYFHDLTSHSQGVLTSVRSGHLKKDLSLLLEKDNTNLPAPYNFNVNASGVPTDVREPSIRPMSPDLLAKNPRITGRHFQSWTNLRHYYRMYRQTSDATAGQGTEGDGSLTWTGIKPYSEVQTHVPMYRANNYQNMNSHWRGSNAYLRIPVLAKLTFIYSLRSQYVDMSAGQRRYRCYLVYTPVFTYWNPYNTELRIPDNTLGSLSSTYQILPMGIQTYLGSTPSGALGSLLTGNAHSFLRSGTGGDIVFAPGELRLFSHTTLGSQSGGQNAPLNLMPGFIPSSYGGDQMQIGGLYFQSQNPGLLVTFSHSAWGGNVSYGNTAGSLCHTPHWKFPTTQGYERNPPYMYQNDWFNLAQTYTPMTPPGVSNIARWVFSDNLPVPVAYAQLVLKGLSEFDYESISWAQDWRCRNWIQAPPFYFGNGLFISENDKIAHTQRLDNPYVMNFGPMSMAEMPKVVGHIASKALLGSGANPFEKITSVATLELPTVPIGGLASFSGMRINPGWTNPNPVAGIYPNLRLQSSGGNNTSQSSLAASETKTIAYQSGVTGPGIGNSFMHPMLPRTDIYQYFNNSVSSDPANRTAPLANINYNDSRVFSDYWDHVFLLNDALWDDYFVSSLADQTRPGASTALSLSANLDKLVAGSAISNSRYRYEAGIRTPAEVKAELQATDGYLKAAKSLVVDGMFNVNSTSAAAWYALFAGIRERQIFYRDSNGLLQKIEIPTDKRIAISRFDTEVSMEEMEDPENGATMPDGSDGWSGVRFLDDEQLQKLAEECVKQVKKRGPFLNFSEFINRRLSDDALGTMGALQSAIDYDDATPDSKSLNYRFKNGPDFMLEESDLGDHAFQSPEAAVGSRFAGIPGYVIQSDLLKPIANTLSVRDDTFRIRAYGEALDASGKKVIARAWCEAIVQRTPEYMDSTNDASVPARNMTTNGTFSNNATLTATNQRFGRKFRIESFRWLNPSEI